MQKLRIPFVLAGLMLVCIGGPRLQAQTVRHPLDPLSWREYWGVLDVLHAKGHLDSKSRISLVQLQEPPKQAVLDWRPGETIKRSAYALVRKGEKSFEATVDLNAGKLTAWKPLKGMQPNWLGEEFAAMSGIIKKHPDFIAAMDRRGISDFTYFAIDSIPPGYFGTDEERGRRIAHCRVVDQRGARNPWTRYLGGLTILADMDKREVIRVVDEGVVAVPENSADYDPDSIGPAREMPGPIRVEQPMGKGFEVDGYEFSWQKWRFHLRPEQRAGLVVSRVQYEDGDQLRDVLYQGFMSEMFVPYMDPAFAWYARNFMDIGEFSVGGVGKPLMRGLDCPDDAYMMDTLVADDFGKPKAVPDTVAVFERYAGDMSWRHWADDHEPESRPKRDLVVRYAAVIGNYDYVIDWVFQQDGSIRVLIGATGIVEAKPVNQAIASESILQDEGADDAYGRFVDRNVVAVNHDHYFSFRLDLDVDGQENSMVMDRLVQQRLPSDHPRRSIWVRSPKIAQRESDAQLNMKLDRPVLWRVANPNRTNHVGYATSYQIKPGMNTGTLLSEDDYPRRRAGFIDHQLWVTPYRVDEQYAAGRHPTLSEPGQQGLPAWTRDDRSIANTDIVAWYTIGMHHLVRGEDWPVMPVMWHSFELRPFDFFDRNPALDIPK